MTFIDTTTITEAVDALNLGGVIAYPTEAVYGLGCDPFNPSAIAKILQLKRRSLSSGFILVAENWEQIESLVEPIEPRALINVLETWPGPVTWVFPAKKEVPDWITGNHNSLAVRVSNHPMVKALCHAFGKPIVSTSANLHGQLPTRDYRTTKIMFGDQLDFIVEGDVGDQARPTMIRDAISGEVIRR